MKFPTTMVCIEPGCPTLVDVPGCWCFEHLVTCDDAGCADPAHTCASPVHFCELHKPPAA